MTRTPVPLRKHAILKRHYRRARKATPQFHQLDDSGQWAVLRQQVADDATPDGAALLDVLDSREGRRREVLSALEAARVEAATSRRR